MVSPFRLTFTRHIRTFRFWSHLHPGKLSGRDALKKMMGCGEKRYFMYFFPIIGLIFSNLTGLISVMKNNSSVTKKWSAWCTPTTPQWPCTIRFSKVNNTSKKKHLVLTLWDLWDFPFCINQVTETQFQKTLLWYNL